MGQHAHGRLGLCGVLGQERVWRDVAPFLTEQKGKTFLLGEAPNAQTAYTQMETELNVVFFGELIVNSGISTAVSEANSALGGM